MSKYEFDYSDWVTEMYEGEWAITDVYVTGMVDEDCTNHEGTDYILWMIVVYNNYNEDGIPGYSVYVYPVADDMSSGYELPYLDITMGAGYHGLQEARDKAIELLQKAYVGELMKY